MSYYYDDVEADSIMRHHDVNLNVYGACHVCTHIRAIIERNTDGKLTFKKEEAKNVWVCRECWRKACEKANAAKGKG